MKRWMLAVVATAMMAGLAGAWIGDRVLSAPAQGTYQAGWANVAYAGETGPIEQKLVSLAQASAIIYHLDNSTGGWNQYVPGRADLSNLTTATKGEAYLAFLTQPVSIDLVACPASTPTPQGCQEWQSLANQCIADYGQCVNSLTECNADLANCADTETVCDLIDDLVSANRDLQWAWGPSLLVKIMFDDDFWVSDWSPTDFAVGDVNQAVSSLEMWAAVHCR